MFHFIIYKEAKNVMRYE